jgi:hypothetical protein
MAKKQDSLILGVQLPNGKIRQEPFSVEHAERILRMPNNGGWGLPIDSEYQFDTENGITRSTQGGTKKSNKETTD